MDFNIGTITVPLNYTLHISHIKTSLHSRTFNWALLQLTSSWVWVLYYDQRSVGQSVLEYSIHLGLTTRFLLLSDSSVFLNVGLSLWREDGSAVYNCCWSSPAHSLFYCLRIEISLFVASYDTQGYSGGIRNRLHTVITSRHGPHRKHRSSITVTLLRSCLLLWERVYWAVALKRFWYICLSRDRCIVTALHAIIY
jgi:hypothetical protein